MTQATDPRPQLRDRIRAAFNAFRDPNRAYVHGLATGIAIYPSVRARVAGK